uniref:Flavanone 4-reductase n=1 Tax=Anthurium amnicola TaxID=1678845 RepID=A0A1D1XZF2_9ARAE
MVEQQLQQQLQLQLYKSRGKISRRAAGHRAPSERMEMRKGPVVVTDAAGFIGSWLVKRLLQQGYAVRATVRDPSNLKKIKPLLDLPNSEQLLTIWKADLTQDGSFDAAVEGCTGVFHVATPMDFESLDPEKEVIKPTVDGVLSILRSCHRAATVERVIFTSSAGTVNVEERQKLEYDESSWSDLEFIRRVKMTGWMYFVSKTLAEKAAWDFAQEKGIHLITIIPTLVVGPFISSAMPPSLITALALITGNEPHYSILKQIQLVHLDDLCNAHIFLFQHPEARGRYICSSHDVTIFELADLMRNRYPEYNVPTRFQGIDDSIQRVRFSSEKLQGLGFHYRYTVEEMLDQAIQSCTEKKLIPLTTEKLCDSDETCGGEKELMAAGSLPQSQANGGTGFGRS